MSTITKAIAAVEFQANSRQANAAMESIRSSAKECRDEVERLQADLAKGIEVTMVAGQEMDINKRIKQLEGMAKSYDQAADSLIKGVKAFDELWKHAQAGNIESMTAAQIRAGMNGAKRVKDQLKLNDPEDRLKNAAIQSMTDESQKVLDKMKLNTDGIIQQLERGESVAKDVLEREQKGLMALMDQLEHGSKEWQVYNAQLVRISKGYDDLIIRERQLKGEIVTREDAIRVANQNDKKATDDAIKNAQQRIDAAQEVIKTKQEEVRTNQVAAEQAAQNLVGVREEIKNKKEEIAQAKANGEAMKKEARERVSAANERKNAAVKNAKEEQQAYNTLNGEVNKLRGEVAGLEAQLAALGQQPVKPKVDSSDIDELNAKLQTAQSLLDQKTTDANNAFNRYLDTKKLKRQDFSDYSDAFVEKYGLQGRTFSHITAADKFRFPYDMNLSQVRDAATDPESDWEIAGPQAKKILADYEWFQEQIGKVADQIHEQYLKLAKANAEGVDIEQLKTVANNIKRLEDLKAKMAQVAEMPAEDYDFYLGGEQFRSQFGDIDKTIDNTSKNIDRAIKKAIDERFDYHDKKHAVEIQEAKEASELADKEKEAAQIAVNGIKAEIETKKQNAGATKNEVEAVKELIKMRERINELQQEKDSMSGIMPTAGIDKELSELMPKYEAGLKGLSEEARNLVRDFTVAKRDLAGIIEDEKEADKALKQFGITTADVADDLKLQAAAEKALKIEEESRLELAKEMLEVRKQIGAESLKDSRIVGSKKDQDFYKKNKGILEDEYWKGEAGGGSIGRMYKYLNDIADDPEAKAEFQEQVGVSVKDAMRVAGQRMREVLQEAMKRGIKVDDALSDFEDGYGQGPATKIHEFFKEFNEAVSEKEGELIRKRRRKLDAILDVVEDPGDEAEMPSRDERLELAKRALKGVAEGHYGNDTPLAESRRQQEEEVTRLDAKVKEFINTQQQSTAATEEHTQAAEKDAATEQKREELKSKLATANGKLAEKEQELNVQTDKTITANQNLRQAEDDVKQATEQKNEVYREAKRVVAEGEDAVEGLEKKEEEYAETQKKATQAVADGTAEINKQSAAQVAAQQEIDQATANSIEKKEQAIKVLEQLNREINDPGNADWQENERTIGRLKQQLEDLRKQSAELRREPLLKEMTERMTDIKNLSVDALGETKKFWEAMYSGADRNDAKLKDFKQHLDDIAAEERRRTEERGKEAMSFFNDKNVFAGVDAEGNQIFRTKAANASAAETVEMAKAMEAYRDSLPKEDGAETIANINRLLEENAEAIKVATGEWMSYTEAEKLASEAAQAGKGEGNFIATQQQMQQAMAAVQREYDKTIKSLQQLERAETKDTNAINEEKAKLQQLEKQLKDLKFEQDNFNMSHEKMQQLLAEPTKATDLEELRAAIKRADGELRRMKDSLGDGSKQYQEFAAKVKEAKNQLKEIESQAKANTSAWDKAWSRLKTYVGMYMGFNMAWQRITGSVDDLMTLSDKMGEVRKTTGFTADEVGRLSDNLKKLDTRTDLTGLMEFSSLAGSIGMKTQKDVQGFTEAANMLAVSLPEMGNEASRTLIKIADATGDLEKNGGNVRETLERVGSTIIALRANSAAAAGPITDFVSRVGAVGAQAGISIDQIAALGATVDALGGRVEMSATALSRMIPAIKNNTFEVANAIGMTEKELKGMTGMEQMVAIFRKLHDSVKQFDMNTEDGMNGAADAVENMLGRSVSMQDVMKQLNQQGARAGIVFGLLSQNVDKLEEQLGTAREAYSNNVALMNEYNKMNDTAAGKWARLKNQLEEFFVNADAQSWISDVIDWLRKLIDLITEKGPIGRFFRWSLVYLSLWKAKWAEAIGTALISLGQYIFATKQSTAATAADTAAKTADAAATEATAVANEHAAVASGKFNKTMKANVIAAVATAVVALGWALYEYAQKAKKAAKQMDVMADVEKKAREESVKERAELEKLYKVTQDQTASMEERKKALKDMVGDAKYQEYYSKLSTESELAATAANAYKELSEQILATARARALDAKAEELQRRRIELEDKRKDREDWENENRGKYRAGKQEYTRQQAYVGSVTGGATAGFQESQIAQRGSAAMKPAIIDEFEDSVRERNRIDGEIEQIDKDLDKLKQQVSKLNIKPDTGDGGSGGGGGGGNNPYGNYDRVKSDYNDWDANALVNRRKEMLERVRALANGADVQAVLSEDAKFISEAVRKNIKTTSDAIEWYNTERLKIQEALHGKHLTNTGDWMDPKQQKIRRKLMQDDMKAYLEELDAYYTERKTEIDQARNDEEISEAEAWNRNIKNEAEWHKRRAELQIMYSNKHKQIVEDEQDAIAAIIAERTGDDAKYIKATIANTRKFSEAVKAMNDQGAKEYRKFQGDLDLGSEKDYNKVEKALGKHLKAMEDIINKERPFNGIVDNLQDNLGKMGILTADLGDDAKSAADELVRLSFLMGEAEKAYTLTVDELLQDMRDHGFKEWADTISNDPNMQQGLLAMLRQTFDSVQDAIKKESGIIKKHVENMLLDVTEAAQAEDTRLQILQNSVSRANSLIGAGAASERVADKLAIKQIQLQITLQETRIRMLQKRGADAEKMLRQDAELLREQGKLEEAKQKEMDADNIKKSVGLTLTKEQVELDKQRISLSEKLEESQNRLFTTLREWATLLSSSVQSVMEASHAGDAEYYNERAKMELTGKGGPGAGMYVIIDDEGTSDARAHYEYLDQEQALERQREIENENAQAEALEKMWDDINNKLSEQITDWVNASLQNASIEANTNATIDNTTALGVLTERLSQGININNAPADGSNPKEDMQTTGDEFASDKQAYYDTLSQGEQQTFDMALPTSTGDFATDKISYYNAVSEAAHQAAQAEIDASNQATDTITRNSQQQGKVTTQNDNKMAAGTQSMFAKMTAAANLYGIAYQAMSNENLSTSQKFQMIALQAAGQAAIAGLTASATASSAKVAAEEGAVASKTFMDLGPIAGPIALAALTAIIGGLMGMAVSKVGKAKSQIAQVTGASVGAGRLSTGMLTYAEGNVNEFTDPASLTPGRSYNVDAADGKTYRAKYTGTRPTTHLTNGPEFHLAGEKGREMIIDAGTTRQITMNDNVIWKAIKTLSGGGRVQSSRSHRRSGVRAFADGNVDDFDTIDSGAAADELGFDPAALQASIDRNSEVLERALAEGIKGVFNVYGPDGLVATYDKGKKNVSRHGEKY